MSERLFYQKITDLYATAIDYDKFESEVWELKSDGEFDEAGPAPFQPQTEAQLLARIDHSLAQIGTGEFSYSEEVKNELLAEIDLIKI